MKYGHFDDAKCEYVIDRVDTPVSWTNYLGVNDLCAVVNQTAGGYVFYKTPEYHRVTRFRPNGVPADRPGHYVYIRDDETGEYWSLSWQPTGKDLTKADYRCRHGLSYSVYECGYDGIKGSQTLFIPLNDPVELWDVKLTNASGKPRKLSVFTYAEFSFHHVAVDNQNFQMSLYCSGASCKDGVIECDLFYEQFGFQFFTSDAHTPTIGFDTTRDAFLGAYRTETNPIAVETGKCSGSQELGGNHCAALHKQFTLQPGETKRVVFMLGEQGHAAGVKARAAYSDFAYVDKCFADLAAFWQNKLSKLSVNTPSQAMNTMLNIWTLYQSEINVMFSRFASFIEVGGRTGLGYRDTAQDAMTIPHSNPEKCKSRIIELLRGLTTTGYGLHLFDPAWFDPDKKDEKPFKSPTVIPEPNRADMIHGLESVCADDALWLVAAVVEYIKETGDLNLADETVTYADKGQGTVYEHLTKILDFSTEQVGANGICKGLRADWNDCLNLGGGESAMVSFLHYWALKNFIELATRLGKTEDVDKYTKIAEKVREVSERILWQPSAGGDKSAGWYARGITKSGRKIGTQADREGKVHMESNTWAVISGVAPRDHAVSAMDAVDEFLYTPWGLMLNAPSYTKPDDEIGFVTRVYPGIKENGAVFSHPNPWAWVAEAKLGRGTRAMKFYDALCPYLQNDKIETRQAEPYMYCQFIAGKDHTKHGRAHHPFMTGSGGWAYFAATRYILGIRPDFDDLKIDPCIPSYWQGFDVTRVWRNATYNIKVTNPSGVEKGVKSIKLNGQATEKIPAQPQGTINEVEVIMG